MTEFNSGLNRELFYCQSCGREKDVLAHPGGSLVIVCPVCESNIHPWLRKLPENQKYLKEKYGTADPVFSDEISSCKGFLNQVDQIQKPD